MPEKKQEGQEKEQTDARLTELETEFNDKQRKLQDLQNEGNRVLDELKTLNGRILERRKELGLPEQPQN